MGVFLTDISFSFVRKKKVRDSQVHRSSLLRLVSSRQGSPQMNEVLSDDRYTGSDDSVSRVSTSCFGVSPFVLQKRGWSAQGPQGVPRKGEPAGPKPTTQHNNKPQPNTLQQQHNTVDLSYTPEPLLHVATFLSTPFEFFALNPILLFTSCLSKLQFFSCFEHFFVKVSESNPILHFRSFLSGQTQSNLTTNP